jgi:hypothetical protein
LLRPYFSRFHFITKKFLAPHDVAATQQAGKDSDFTHLDTTRARNEKTSPNRSATRFLLRPPPPG